MKSRCVMFIVIVLGSMLLLSKAPCGVIYVDIHNTAPASPYADLSTAATNIQDAIDAATNGDIVLVNDGVYQDGFRVTLESSSGALQKIPVTNRIVVGKALTVESLHGPSTTIIDGGDVYRCVWATNHAMVSGFTLTHGRAGYVTPSGGISVTNGAEGGAVSGRNLPSSYLPTISNCVLKANVALGNGGGASGCYLVDCVISSNQAVAGGGALDSQLVNCRVTWNRARTNAPVPDYIPFPEVTPAGVGGGTLGCSSVNCLIANNAASKAGGVYYPAGLWNCTIVSNSALKYGGVYLNGLSSSPYAYASNCVIYFNAADTNANFGATNLFADHCCISPMPTSGIGNITNDPMFMDLAAGDLHLQSNSPCINSGGNAAATTEIDLDGNSRIAGGTIDMGAYEYQTPSSILSYAWANRYGLPTDGSADYCDSDGDGLNNWQELIAGTNPTNAASLLTISNVVPVIGANRVIVKWQSTSTRTYYLQRSSDLSAPNAFVTIHSNIIGVEGVTTYMDSADPTVGSYYYRVGVQ